MRKFLFVAMLSAAALAGNSALVQAQSYGPGMMGGYGPGYSYGSGYMMGPGYGHGWMMGGGGYGPGMMGYGYGYGADERDYRSGPRYRGDRLCWRKTDSAHGYGYYARCRN